MVKIDHSRMIRLKAEMKLRGDAWLEFEIRPAAKNLTSLMQSVFFAPKGLLGLVYWHILWPIHELIFCRMINELATSAERA